MNYKPLLIASLCLCCGINLPAEDYQVNLSEAFSRQFELAETVYTNAFEFDLHYMHYRDGSVKVLAANVTSRLRVKEYTYLNQSIFEWFETRDSLLTALSGDSIVQDSTGQDSICLRTHVCYSPLYFAQDKDTLFCSALCYNDPHTVCDELPVVRWFYVRNNRQSTYYAVLRRKADELALKYYDALTHSLEQVQKFTINGAMDIRLHGNDLRMTEDGKTVRCMEKWQSDSLLYALLLDPSGKVKRKYEFGYEPQAVFPKLTKKKYFYPSQAPKLIVAYGGNGDSVQAFNAKGKSAVYTPVSDQDAEKEVFQYFSKNFRAPRDKKTNGINDITALMAITCRVSEDGLLHLAQVDSTDIRWSYSYDSLAITYLPYLTDFAARMQQQQFPCPPARVNQSAVESYTRIGLECTFSPGGKATVTHLDPDSITLQPRPQPFISQIRDACLHAQPSGLCTQTYKESGLAFDYPEQFSVSAGSSEGLHTAMATTADREAILTCTVRIEDLDNDTVDLLAWAQKGILSLMQRRRTFRSLTFDRPRPVQLKYIQGKAATLRMQTTDGKCLAGALFVAAIQGYSLEAFFVSSTEDYLSLAEQILATARFDSATLSQLNVVEGVVADNHQFDKKGFVFTLVDDMPEFPGGKQAMFKFLSENVRYPVIAQQKNIQGRVICQFIVEKDGSLTDVIVIRSGGDASLDKEAVRVIKAMPNWKPGKQRGRPVRVKYTTPITFRLPDADNKKSHK